MSTALSLAVGAASSGTTPQMILEEIEVVDEMVTSIEAEAFLLEHYDEQVVGNRAARSVMLRSTLIGATLSAVGSRSTVETLEAAAAGAAEPPPRYW